MRILISSIGSRGDVQPIVALALELRALGHDPKLCVAPNFKDWLESFGLVCVPIGPDLKKLTGGSAPSIAPSLSDEQRRQFAAQAIRTQFPVMNEAARGEGRLGARQDERAALHLYRSAMACRRSDACTGSVGNAHEDRTNRCVDSPRSNAAARRSREVPRGG